MKHLTWATCMAVAAWCLSGFGSDPLDTWQWRNPIPNGQASYAITYANGTFAAVGYAGDVASSPDGTNWVRRNIGPIPDAGTNYAFKGIAWGNGVWVAVGVGSHSGGGSFPLIMTSSNLVTWTAQALPQDIYIQFYSVIYASGQFVAVGTGYDLQAGVSFPGILTSPDGVQWIRQGVAATDPALKPDLKKIAYGNGVFVGVTINGSIYTSSDATNWTGQTFGPMFLYGLTYGSGTFLVDSSPQGVLASSDGLTWTVRAPPIDGWALNYGDGLFVAGGDNGQIKTSPDGVKWTKRNSGAMNNFVDIAFGNGTFVGVGIGALVVSPNGTNWLSLDPTITTKGLNGVTYGQGSFVAVGWAGTRLHSADGAHWSMSATGPSAVPDLYATAFGGGHFVAVGSQGTILASTNGSNWVAASTGLPLLLAVGYGGGRFVAVGTGGAILSSSNSTSWTIQDPGVTADLKTMAYGNGLFVIGADTGTLTSTDGIAWAWHDLNVSSTSINGLGFGKGTFVAVGDGGLILMSTNGMDWATASNGTTVQLYSVAYGAGTFLVTGLGGTLLSSTDGTNWVSHDLGTTTRLLSAAFGQDTFVVVGDTGTILQSGVMPQVSARLSPLPGWTNGAFGLSLTASTSSSWELQASADLRNWTPLATVSITNAGWQFLDAGASAQQQRYYRAIAR